MDCSFEDNLETSIEQDESLGICPGDNLKDNVPSKTTILRHVIDGFVIEESIRPFPPQVSCMLTARQLHMIRKRQMEIMSREKENPLDDPLSRWSADREHTDAQEAATATCEQCGFSGPRCRFTQPHHRFCSLCCARKYSSGCASRAMAANKLRQAASAARRGRARGTLRVKMMGRGRRAGAQGRGRRKSVNTGRLLVSPSPSHSLSDSNSFSESEESTRSVFSCSPSPEPVIPHSGVDLVTPLMWSVDDVWNYIRSLPDSSQHAEDFRSQEIDGSALLLLHEDHLVGSMNLPLGPALKLCAHIDKLRRTL